MKILIDLTVGEVDEMKRLFSVNGLGDWDLSAMVKMFFEIGRERERNSIRSREDKDSVYREGK